MSKMIALVHESAAASRGIGWNPFAVRELSNEIKALAAKTARKILSTPTSGESRTMQQVRQHVTEGVVLVSSRTHADPIDLPKVLAEYDEVRTERDTGYKAFDAFTLAVEGVLEGRPATTYINQFAPLQYEMLERIEQRLRTPTPPVRKLREYKGVTYRDGQWDNGTRITENVFRALAHMLMEPSDEDYRALIALRADAEKVETLEGVILSWFGPTVTQEYRDRLCTRIRAWLATQEPTS
jgi:hypothetical protein